jgi:hypothetical protein
MLLLLKGQELDRFSSSSSSNESVKLLAIVKLLFDQSNLTTIAANVWRLMMGLRLQLLYVNFHVMILSSSSSEFRILIIVFFLKSLFFTTFSNIMNRYSLYYTRRYSALLEDAARRYSTLLDAT